MLGLIFRLGLNFQGNTILGLPVKQLLELFIQHFIRAGGQESIYIYISTESRAAITVVMQSSILGVDKLAICYRRKQIKNGSATPPFIFQALSPVKSFVIADELNKNQR